MDSDSGKGTDPNQAYDEQRARGEDPKLANLTDAQVKEKLTRPAPFKITGEGK